MVLPGDVGAELRRADVPAFEEHAKRRVRSEPVGGPQETVRRGYVEGDDRLLDAAAKQDRVEYDRYAYEAVFQEGRVDRADDDQRCRGRRREHRHEQERLVGVEAHPRKPGDFRAQGGARQRRAGQERDADGLENPVASLEKGDDLRARGSHGAPYPPLVPGLAEYDAPLLEIPPPAPEIVERRHQLRGGQRELKEGHHREDHGPDGVRGVPSRHEEGIEGAVEDKGRRQGLREAPRPIRSLCVVRALAQKIADEAAGGDVQRRRKEGPRHKQVLAELQDVKEVLHQREARPHEDARDDPLEYAEGGVSAQHQADEQEGAGLFDKGRFEEAFGESALPRHRAVQHGREEVDEQGQEYPEEKGFRLLGILRSQAVPAVVVGEVPEVYQVEQRYGDQGA